MDWQDEFLLGIKEIDEQHKMLMHSFSILKEAIAAGHAWSDTHYKIVELKELAIVHFTVEEALMRLFGYPSTEDHRSIHERFLITLDDILNMSIRSAADEEMLKLIREWLTHHILVTDRDYVRHILSGASVVRA